MCIEGKIIMVNKYLDSGNICELVLDNDVCIEGDVFIDCIGFWVLLIGEVFGVGYDDWSYLFVVDCVIVV